MKRKNHRYQRWFFQGSQSYQLFEPR